MTVTRKSRTFRDIPDTVSYYAFANQDRSVRNRVSGVQITESEGHPWHVKPRPEGDVGGDFTTVKISVRPGSYATVSSNGKQPGESGSFYGATMYGPVFPVPLDSVGSYFSSVADSQSPTLGLKFNNFPDYSSSDNTLAAQGTLAIDRCSPTNSVASIAQTLGELKRDGIPDLVGVQSWKHRTEIAKGAGSEYLNYQFGWKPLLQDVMNFATAASKAGKYISQLERDSGRLVRRRYEFPSETRLIELPEYRSFLSPGMPGAPGYEYGETVASRRYVKVKTERWFSGAFTYYLPSGGSAFDRVRRGYVEFDKLFGGVDPDTLWNLTPWSWATDWFFNTGSVIKNLTDAASFGLVLPYGYIMERTSVEYSFRGGGPKHIRDPNITFPVVFDHVIKKRRKATPFGFGLTWESFSGFQLSILAALGITRSRTFK